MMSPLPSYHLHQPPQGQDLVWDSPPEDRDGPTILAVQDPVRPCGGAGVCDCCAVWIVCEGGGCAGAFGDWVRTWDIFLHQVRTYVESRWTAWCHSSDNTSKLVPGPISKLVYYMISLLACSEFHGGIILAGKNLLQLE